MERKFFVTCLMVKDDEILMLQKEKGRHIGTWLFPGGKIKDHESPKDTVLREIENDTGLKLENVELRGITDFMMQENEDSKEKILGRTTLYVFYADLFSGKLKESVKGKLSWVPMKEMWNKQNGKHDHLFIPAMLESTSIKFAKIYINQEMERIGYELN